MKLQNKNAIITGGTHGLGSAIVKEFLSEGANVLFCARSEAGVRKAEMELRPALPPSQILAGEPCDVSSVADVRRLFEVAAAKLGQIHILVNNAGIYGPKGPSDEVGWDEWKRSIEINLYGTFLPCRAVMPVFKKARGGKIVNLSGGGATNPMPCISSYAASKAAVVRLTETLAMELREFNVDVNAVAPGALNTRLLDEVLEAGPGKVGAAFYEKALQQSAGGGVPLEKGARLCVYLASEQSNGITGRLLSAQWDPWQDLQQWRGELDGSDIYTLRRITPKERGRDWG